MPRVPAPRAVYAWPATLRDAVAQRARDIIYFRFMLIHTMFIYLRRHDARAFLRFERLLDAGYYAVYAMRAPLLFSLHAMMATMRI